MRDKIIGFIISIVCFIITLGFVPGRAMALPFVPTDWTWEMYQGLHMLGDLIANDVNFDIPDWVDFNDFDDVKAFLEMIYNEGKKKVAYASIIADMCVGTWNHFLETGEVSLPFSETTVKRTHNTGFFQHIVDTINAPLVPSVPVDLETLVDQMSVIYMLASNSNGVRYDFTTVSLRFNDLYGSVFWNNRENYSYAKVPRIYGYIPTNLLSIYVDEVNGEYVVSCPEFTKYYSNEHIWGYYFNEYHYWTTALPSGYRESDNSITLERVDTSDLNQVVAPNGTFNTLYDALNYINNNFVHVQNLFVNGENWIGSGAIDNPLGVVIPQNVIDEVENGKISGLVIDATLPDTDNLVGSIDLGVVMDDLREAQINGRESTLDRVRTKGGVRALDGTVVGTVSKAVAIDVPSTVSLVTAADDWGYIPYYPEIPSAFSGTTILSELIDATQTIVPNDLIMAIWGLVIILFIIALINIFHK